MRPSPVYIFIFDEWSPDRFFSEGQIRAEYAHLAAFAGQAVTFQDALSPGTLTTESMPRFLFQTQLQPFFRDGDVGFTSDGVFKRARDLPSVFSTFSSMGFRTVMIGSYMPYSSWLGDQVDFCRSHSLYPRADDPAERVGGECWNAICYWTDPWAQTVIGRYSIWLSDIDVLRVYERVETDVKAVISRPPSRIFAVFHLMLPHKPFIVDPDGSYRGPDPASHQTNLAGYVRNLKRLDVLVGECVQLMRDAGSFDSSLVVLTSDHSWRWDPGRASGEIKTPRNQVPLLIKLPFQREAVSVSQRVETRELGKLLEWALTPDASPGGVAEFVGRHGSGQSSAEVIRGSEPEELTGRAAGWRGGSCS